MGTGRDLDKLGESIADLTSRQRSKESEVQESVHRGVVRAQPVLIVAVVDGDLDGDRSIDQANDSRRDPNEVGVSAVGRARKATVIR